MKKLALIGYPLSHSFSANYFGAFFERESLSEWSYELLPIERIEEVKSILADEQMVGFNVTIPYKKQIIPYLDQVDEVAVEIGAVNCVKLHHGESKGYNTDIYGFERSLVALIGECRPPALVLGTGGASLAVCYVLRKLGIDFVVVSRSAHNGGITYADVDEKVLSERLLVVNCTPVGTFPHVEEAPLLPYEWMTESHFAYDLVYNPAETEFLRRARKKGAAVCNGYAMLIGQAEAGWEIFQKSSL